jgi:O-antigen/teichoic acid export membrane protein
MLMSGRAMAFAVTFFVPAVLARVFTQVEFGTYKQFMLITYTLFSFGQFGFAECLFYFLPANPTRGGRYAFNSLLMLGLMGIVFSTLLLLNSSRVAYWLNNEPLATYMPLAALYLIFMLMGTVLEITMISRKNFRLATATYVVSDVLRAAFLVLPALIMRNLEWTLIGGIAFCALRVARIFQYFRSEFGRELRFDTAVLREQAAYALPFFCSVILHIVQQNYHQYAVSWHFDAATFAIYSVGCLQIPLVDFMATPAANVMMVQMGEDIRDGRPERLLTVWHDTTRKLALLFFPLVGLLVANAYQLITLLYTTAYAASVPIFMVWSLMILFSAFQTDGVLRTFADNRFLFIMNMTRLAAIIALMGWFLSTFQLMGAVFLTLGGVFLVKGMAIVRMKTLFGTTFIEVLPWKSLGSVLIVAMLSALPAILVNTKLDAPSLVVLPISGLAYMLTYTTLTLMFGLLSDGEKAAIKRSLYVWNRGAIEPERQTSI